MVRCDAASAHHPCKAAELEALCMSGNWFYKLDNKGPAKQVAGREHIIWHTWKCWIAAELLALQESEKGTPCLLER